MYNFIVRCLIWALFVYIMFLHKLKLENYRNISNVEFSFNKYINIFIGDNAQGKTNVLESIYFLAITKSHRTNDEINLIKNNELYTKVSGKYQNDLDEINELSILLNKEGKQVSVNNVIQKKISNYLSRFNVIMFSPNDIDLIKGFPLIRRRFLNIELSQIDFSYISILKKYNRLLKQRNEYLKNNIDNFDNVYFDIITDELIDLNIKILQKRILFIEKINSYFKEIFFKITNNKNIIIKYKSFINYDNLSNDELKNKIKSKFKSVFEKEISYKMTLIGIHKDDFSIILDDKNICEYGSQGQQKVAVLSLKLAEIKYLMKIKNTKPIILLDDIFSELDTNKKNNILNYFNEKLQIFITTTDLNNINSETQKNADIFIVKNGSFKGGIINE